MEAFLHFGVNTLSGSEWGSGQEQPKAFNPAALDASQWVRAIRSAGASGVVLICKHHDGFCLWPSKFTDHSVRNSPWRGGQGDLVRKVSEACRQAGLRFGVYLSPGDLHEPTYGRDSAAYNEYFCNQLRELLSNYGEISEVWFDGAQPSRLKQSYVCDVSLGPDWFWDAKWEREIKSLDQLKRIYESSVGRNAGLLLNIGPDRRGLIPDSQVRRLKEFGDWQRASFAKNLLAGIDPELAIGGLSGSEGK